MKPAVGPAPSLPVQRDCQDEETEHQYAKPTGPPIYARNSLQEGNTLMRQSIASWNALSPVPPACRTVSFSSWRRFSTTSTNSKSSEDMRASVLLEDHGTTPEFDMPLLERCGLPVRESMPCDNPDAERTFRRSSSGLYIANNRRHIQRIHSNHPVRTSSTSSWTTARSASSSQLDTLPEIRFQKQMVRPASTSSLLTQGIKESPPRKQRMVPPKIAMKEIAKELGLKRMNIEDLPEDAFETDSEDEG